MTDTADDRPTVRILAFAGSLRDGSLNRNLIELAVVRARTLNAEVTLCSLADFDCPSYSQDRQDAGFPDGAERFRELIEQHDALMIASPEYNFSMPGALKNAIDWVSRYRPQPFGGKHALLMSASPSMAGGNRGLWALRVPLEHLGVHCYPEMFSFAQASRNFTDDGQIESESLRELFDGMVTGFVELVEASRHYTCLKRRWVEHLGENPELVRVDI